MLYRLMFLGSLFICFSVLKSEGADPPLLAPPPPAAEKVPEFKIITDPLERLNRAFYGFNNGFTWLIIHPFEKGYSFAVPAPARRHLTKLGYNWIYPNRLVNTLLQGKFKGAGVETERFLVNTTIGLLGLFDPATKMGIGNYDEDFGKTFAHYGAGFGFYFVIPIFGPSSLRDGLGKPLDDTLNPAGLIFLDYFFLLNDLSFTLPQLERLDTMELDPYATNRDLWALDRKRKVLDYDEEPEKHRPPAKDIEPVPTLNAVFMRASDPNFFQRAKERSALIPATGRKLPYSVWMQNNPAPLVFIVEGIGMHRLAESGVAEAESVYQKGFSAVTIDSPTNWEFIERAGSRGVPGYSPVDAADLNGALQAIYQDLAARYPGRITSTALIGSSLGGLEALFVADLQARQTGGFQLDRVIAVNPPVDLIHAVTQVDEYYREPLKWPEAERMTRMESALLRATTIPGITYKPGEKLPFTAAESKFLIGFFYHMILRSIIYASQQKENLGIVQVKLGGTKRQPQYDALGRFDYTDYVRQFVLPYYLKGMPGATQEDLIARASLRAIGPGLANNSKVRIFTNSNDFLLTPDDIAWLHSMLDGRLTVFEGGGHLGNRHLPEVRAKIMAALDGLK